MLFTHMEFIVKYAIFVILLFSLPTLLQAETYKWVNEDGVVTYSQTPPPDGNADKIDIKSGAKEPGPSSKEKLDELRQRMADHDEDRQEAKQKAEEKKSLQEMKKKNCEIARSNLQKLQGLGQRLYKKDGEYKRLSEEDRQSLMKQAQEQIKADCGAD
jgi:hypothetical protein